MSTPDSITPPGSDPEIPLLGETVPCSIWICGPGGEVPHPPCPDLFSSGARASGCRDTGLVGEIHPEDLQAALASRERSIAAGMPWRHMYRIRDTDGEFRTVVSSGIPVRDAGGQVVLWAGVTLDATGRNESGEPARELWTLSAIARVIEAGDADPEEIFQRVACLLPRGFRHPERISVRVESGTAAPGPGRIVAGRFVVECREKPGDPFLPQERGLVCTAAAMLEAAVAPEYRLLFDHMPDAALLLAILRDGSGSPAGLRVIRINRKAEEVLGRRREEVAGEDLAAAVPSFDPAALDLLYQAAGTGTPVHHEVYDPVLDVYYGLKAYRPKYDRLVVIVDDITERQRAREALREQRNTLDDRVRELGVFYSMAGIVERPGISVDEILAEVAAALPAGWLHPGDASARITLDGREYPSAGFVETCWKQESPIVVCGRIAGRVEVCYSHEEPEKDEGPFLAEERSLIDAVAGRLGRIIERVQANETLRRSEKKYRLLFEQMLESYTLYEVITDDTGSPVDYRLIELNEKAAAAFDHSREELIRRRLFDVFPAIREGARAIYGEVAETGAPVQRRLQEPKTGRWYDLHIYRPEIGRLVVTGQEITEQKRAELALRESEERFRGIAQRSFDMIYTCYVDRGITYVSPAVKRILGYTPEEMIGVPCGDYVARETLNAWLEAMARVTRGESVEGLVVKLRRKDGSAAIVEMNASPIVEGGSVVGIQVVGRDVSDRKRYEDMRLQAFYQIEQNIEQFAILADHIRLPLQVILGMADLADDAKTSEKIREQVKRINGIVKQLDEGWIESREIREFLRRNELV